MSDAELADLVSALPDEAQYALSARSGGVDGAVDIPGLRDAMRRARMKGFPDQVAAAVTEPCLDACIEALGDKADFPSEAELAAVLPGLVSSHGMSTVRLMLASAALQDAPAAGSIQKLLKSSPVLRAGD
jgi:hypothetical protein